MSVILMIRANTSRSCTLRYPCFLKHFPIWVIWNLLNTTQCNYWIIQWSRAVVIWLFVFSNVDDLVESARPNVEYLAVRSLHKRYTFSIRLNFSLLGGWVGCSLNGEIPCLRWDTFTRWRRSVHRIINWRKWLLLANHPFWMRIHLCRILQCYFIFILSWACI